MTPFFVVTLLSTPREVRSLNRFTAASGATDPQTESAEAHVGRGYEYVKDRRYGEAAREFEQVLQLEPALTRVRYQLAVCYFALMRHHEAREQFARIEREPGDHPQVVYYLGRLDLMEGDLEAAVRRLESITAAPPFPDTLHYLGSAYLRQGNLEVARRWLENAARATPRDARVYDHLARVHQAAGRRREAEAAYARAADLRRQQNEASHQAVACSHALETSSLEEAFAKCQVLFDAQDVNKLTSLGMIYGQHRHFDEALPAFEQAARLDPDSYEVQYNLGLTYFRLKRFAEARLSLEKAATLRPDFFGVNALLGAVLFALGEDRAALENLQRAHRLRPDDAETVGLLCRVRTALGQKELRAGRYSASLAQFREALRLQPQNIDVYMMLAQVFRALGDHRQAEQALRQAEQLRAPKP